MKRNILLWSALLCTSMLSAQQPWKLDLTAVGDSLTLRIDLYEESIPVPSMEMFGPMNGYMSGDIYRVWAVTSFEIIDDRTAKLRLSNDMGSETQAATLSALSDSTYRLKFDGYNAVRRVSKGKKLVKAPSEFLMQKRVSHIRNVGRQ